MESQLTRDSVLRKYIALPQDHGSWVFIISPLLIGLFAGGTWTAASGFLIVAAFSAFLIRQPVTLVLKAYTGRRSRRDLPAAWFWITVYSLTGLVGLAGLILLGFGFILVLALPGIPVFAWHLYLVSRRAERRQIGVEVVATGVLALAAPAAFWVGRGSALPLGWLLFLLVWLQSAASIVYAYLRLAQRALPAMPDLHARIRMGSRPLLYTTFNLMLVLILGISRTLPILVFLPYAVQWAETVWGVLHPAIGVKPTRIGIRQLIISSLFTLLFILTFQI